MAIVTTPKGTVRYQVEDKSGRRFDVSEKGFDPSKYAYVRMINDETGEKSYIPVANMEAARIEGGFREYRIGKSTVTRKASPKNDGGGVVDWAKSLVGLGDEEYKATKPVAASKPQKPQQPSVSASKKQNPVAGMTTTYTLPDEQGMSPVMQQVNDWMKNPNKKGDITSFDVMKPGSFGAAYETASTRLQESLNKKKTETVAVKTSKGIEFQSKPYVEAQARRRAKEFVDNSVVSKLADNIIDKTINDASFSFGDMNMDNSVGAMAADIEQGMLAGGAMGGTSGALIGSPTGPGAAVTGGVGILSGMAVGAGVGVAKGLYDVYAKQISEKTSPASITSVLKNEKNIAMFRKALLGSVVDIKGNYLPKITEYARRAGMGNDVRGYVSKYVLPEIAGAIDKRISANSDARFGVHNAYDFILQGLNEGIFGLNSYAEQSASERKERQDSRAKAMEDRSKMWKSVADKEEKGNGILDSTDSKGQYHAGLLTQFGGGVVNGARDALLGAFGTGESIAAGTVDRLAEIAASKFSPWLAKFSSKGVPMAENFLSQNLAFLPNAVRTTLINMPHQAVNLASFMGLSSATAKAEELEGYTPEDWYILCSPQFQQKAAQFNEQKLQEKRYRLKAQGYSDEELANVTLNDDEMLQPTNIRQLVSGVKETLKAGGEGGLNGLRFGAITGITGTAFNVGSMSMKSALGRGAMRVGAHASNIASMVALDYLDEGKDCNFVQSLTNAMSMDLGLWFAGKGKVSKTMDDLISTGAKIRRNGWKALTADTSLRRNALTDTELETVANAMGIETKGMSRNDMAMEVAKQLNEEYVPSAASFDRKSKDILGKDVTIPTVYREDEIKKKYEQILDPTKTPLKARQKMCYTLFGNVQLSIPFVDNIRVNGNKVEMYANDGELIDVKSFESNDELHAILADTENELAYKRFMACVPNLNEEEINSVISEAWVRQYGYTPTEWQIREYKTDLAEGDYLRGALEITKLIAGDTINHLYYKVRENNPTDPDVSSVIEAKAAIDAENNNFADDNIPDEQKFDAVNKIYDSISEARSRYAKATEGLVKAIDRDTTGMFEGVTPDKVTPEFIQGLDETASPKVRDAMQEFVSAQNVLGNAEARKQAFISKQGQNIEEALQVMYSQISYKDGGADNVVSFVDGEGKQWFLRTGAIDEQGRLTGDMVTFVDANGEVKFGKAEDYQDIQLTAQGKDEYLNLVREIVKRAVDAQFGLSQHEAELATNNGEIAPGSVNNSQEVLQGSQENGNFAEPKAEQSVTNETPTGEAPKAEFPKGKDGKDDYLAEGVTPETALARMREKGLDDTEIAELVDAKLKKSKAPKMSDDEDKYLEAKAKYAREQEIYNGIKAQIEAEKQAVAEQGRLAHEKELAEAQAKLAEQQRKANIPEQEAFNNNKATYQQNRTEGARTFIYLPNGEKIYGHYVLGETGDTMPSHDPLSNFKQYPGVPRRENGTTNNDRDYEHDVDAQNRAIEHGMNYHLPNELPAVSTDGVTVSGNERDQAHRIAVSNDKAETYESELREKISQFGFSEEDLNKYEHPEVRFEIEGEVPYNTDTYAKFNASERKSMNSTETSVKHTKLFSESPEAVKYIVGAIAGKDSIDSFYKDTDAQRAVIDTLVKAGIWSDNDRAMYQSKTGALTRHGRIEFENVVRGLAFTEDVIRILDDDDMVVINNAALKATPMIVENNHLGDYSVMRVLEGALKTVYSAIKTDYYNKGNIWDYYKQKEIVEKEFARTDEEGNPVYTDEEKALGVVLSHVLAKSKKTNSAKFLADFLESYNKQAKTEIELIGSNMFGDEMDAKPAGEVIEHFIEEKTHELVTVKDKNGHETTKPRFTDEELREIENAIKSLGVSIKSDERGGAEAAGAGAVEKPAEIPTKPVGGSGTPEEKPTKPVPPVDKPTAPEVPAKGDDELTPEEYIAKYPMTEADIDATDVSDNRKEMAKGFLNGSDTSSLARSAYRSVYKNHMANKPAEEPKPAESAATAALGNMAAILAKIKKAGEQKPNNSEFNAYNIDKLNDEQNDLMLDLIEAGAKAGYEMLKDGVKSKEEWKKFFTDNIGEALKDSTGFDDKDVDDLLEDLWNSPYKDTEKGETKKISEWAKEYGINENENNNGTGETNAPNMGEQEGDGTPAVGTTRESGENKPETNGGSDRPANEGGRGTNVHGGNGTGEKPTGGRRKPTTAGGGNTGGIPTDGGDVRGGEGRPTDDGRGTGLGDQGSNEQPATASVGRNTVNLSQEKVPYVAASDPEGKHSIGSVIPSGVASAINVAFKRLVDETQKNVTDFVRDELGYSSNDEMLSDYDSDKSDGLASEQVDSVALAINSMKKGKSFIIGDMTGVGKGRQGAALIRWGVENKKKVLFITESSKLFSEMYTDLKDIGSDYLPYVVNDDTEANITNSDGVKIIGKPSQSAHKALWKSDKYELPKNKKGKQYNFMMMTYSQASNANTANAKRKLEWIKEYAKDAIVIMDESHNASGNSNRGEYFQNIVENAEGVTFLSATYAKRPDNMMLYSLKSSLSDINMPKEAMFEAIKKYGVPMQEILANGLFGSGEMIRRERDMSDVKTTWCDAKEVYTEDEYQKSRKTSDKTVDIVNGIIDFQRTYIDPIVKKIEGEFNEDNEKAVLLGAPQKHCTNTPYSSQVSNVINLLTYGLKAKKAADMAIQQIKDGKKPVIAVENTLGSYVNDIEGDVDNVGFNMVFDKGVKFSLRYKIATYVMNNGTGKYEKDKDSEQIYDAFENGDLDTPGQLALSALRQRIQDYIGDADIEQLTLSPIDMIKEMLADAGYKCGEITGRGKQLVKGEDGKYHTESISIKKKKAATKFNGGSASNPMKKDEAYDALIMNVAGATGISLHASKKFGDQRPRTMIILQPARDVNIEVQMRGRIDRTGQIHRGEYFYVTSPIPAEQKISMMLKQKLASLDANSAGTENVSSNKVDTQDMDNKYGDDVAYEFLLDHLNDINAYLDNGLRFSNETREWEGHEGLLYDVLKGMQRMDCDTQEFIIEELTNRYADKIEYLNQNGINDLKTTIMKLDAKTIDKAMFIKGKDEESENQFAHNTNLERVEVNVLKNPLHSEDIQKRMKKLGVLDDNGKVKSTYCDEVAAKVDEARNAAIADKAEKLAEAEKKLEEKIRQAHPKTEEESEDEYNQKIYSWPTLVEKRGKSNEQLSQLKAELYKQVNCVTKAALYLKPGMPYLVPLTDDLGNDAPMNFGRFMGFELKDGSPRKIQAVFAVKDSRAMISVPCVNSFKVIEKIINKRSDTFLMELYHDENDDFIPLNDARLMPKMDAWWDSRIPKNTSRQHRFMITGNILQACGSLGKYKGQIVTFTRKNEDGSIGAEKGMLLAENFDPENFKVRSAVKKGDIWNSYRDLKDSVSNITARREGDNMVVVFKKREDQKLVDHPVMKDTELADLALAAGDGTKFSRGKDDIAMMFPEKNVEKALELLYTNHSFTKERFFVMPDSTDKPDAITKSNKPYADIIDELKDKYGRTRWMVENEIAEMMKRYKMDIDNEQLKAKIREAVQLRQAYYRKENANEEDRRLAWKYIIHEGREERCAQRMDQAEDDSEMQDYKMKREREHNIKEAILEEMEFRGLKGTEMHLAQGETSVKDMKAVFDKLNKNKENAELMKAVYEKIKDLKMNIVLNETIDDNTGGQAAGKVIEYNWKYMNSKFIPDQSKADTILHEMIHTVTVYACKAVERDMEHLLKPEMVDAVNELKNIFKEIENQDVFEHDTYRQYGVTNVYEMLSEAGSNESFRNDLKKANLWTRLLDGILRFFGYERAGAKKVNAYDSIRQRLDDLIEGFDQHAWEEFWKGSRYGEYGKSMDAQKMVEEPLRKEAEARAEADNEVGAIIRRLASPYRVDEFTLRDNKELKEFKKTPEFEAKNAIARTGTLVGDRRWIMETSKENGGTLLSASAGAFNLAESGIADPERARYIADNIIPMLEMYRDDLIRFRKEYTSKKPFDNEIADVEKAIKWYEEFGNGMHLKVGDHADDGIRFRISDTDRNSYEVEERIKSIVGAKTSGSGIGSAYATGETDNGESYVIRVGNHPMKLSNLDEHDESAEHVLSIIVSDDFDGEKWVRRGFERIDNSEDGDGNISQVVIDPNNFDEQWFKHCIERFKRNGNADDLSDVHFRTVDKPFYSNAGKAVDDVKQDKASGEQWLAMLKKNGGLKAEEDKWMGLSDWLKDKKSVTKDEIKQFIAENSVKVEEVKYSDASVKEKSLDALEDRYPGISESFHFESDTNFPRWTITNDKKAADFYERQTGKKSQLTKNGFLTYDKADEIIDWFDKLMSDIGEDRTINNTRLRYTTDGLENNKEIALVVPTIEPYSSGDNVHFGDAGEGRAVAWVRFGDATDTDGSKVLVIDEIQSKRHQDGREHGYYGDITDEEYSIVSEYVAAKDVVKNETPNLNRLKGRRLEDAKMAIDEAKAIISDKIDQYGEEYLERLEDKMGNRTTGVPDAPFRKNWHELAMKRMLRYAAENGYDKVAWTTGEQQAERYDIGKFITAIEKIGSQNGRDYSMQAKNGHWYDFKLSEDKQTIIESEIPDMEGKTLAEVFGREYADKIEALNLDSESIHPENFMAGGEGMKGFYDQMLPRFMDKYGKKWGVKTGEVKLDLPNEEDRVMHSVDVTPEMKESVMQGQPMFRVHEGGDATNDYGVKVAEKAQKVLDAMDNGGKVVMREADLDETGRKALKHNPNATGWYNTKTGEVTVYLPNCRSEHEVMKTIWHEKIGHEGMRKALGEEGYKRFYNNLWMAMTPEERSVVTGKAQRRGWDYNVAMDEHLAELAEDFDHENNHYTLWQKIKDVFNLAVSKLTGHKASFTINDVRTAMWLSKHAQENKIGSIDYRLRKAAFEAKLRNYKMEELTSSNDYRFREATKDERDAIDENFTALGKEARSQYERALKKVGYLWTEAHQYNMEALKVLQEAICGGKEKVKDAWNACMAFNHLGSIDQQEQEKFMRDLCTPLYDHIKKCLPAFEGKTPSEREANFDSYVHAKSGLERNRTIFVRDAIREMAKEDPDAAQDLQNDYDAKRAELKAQLDKGGQYTLREFYQDLDKWINDNIGEFDANTMDRSGLSDMEKYGDKWAVSDKGEYNDAEVINHVIECESKMGKDVTDNLWNQIGKIGQFSIDKDYNSHYINEKAKKRMETMFGWYVPMRGFNEMTADEQWNYLNGGDNYVGMTAMKMNGRISAPKSVIPTLLAMGDAAILRGNRNMAKQTLLRMVRENENDLMREVKIHYIKDIDPNTGEITLTPIYPAFKEGDTPAQVDKAMEDLDSKIEQLKASGKEVVELSDMTSSQPYRITNESNLKEHLINMRVNGKNVSLMVFSHPRAAQAVNGMLTNTGSKKLREFNAVLSQLATSRSLTFMARNAIRDYGLGVNSALATESLNWQKNYHAMYWKLIGNFVANTVKGNALMENGNSMLQLFAKYRANKLDESNEVEKYFKQFVENGGVTGYVQMRGVDQMHEELNKAITSFKNADTTGKAQKAWDNTIGKWFDIVESYNEGIENQSRFAAFYASRKEGRSIMRSVDDAKNISVNFNKTGAGSATQSMKWGDETHWYKMNRYLASHSAWLLKNCSLFYNAGIQGMSRNYQIWKDGGVFTRTKMIAAFMAKPFALALGMPALCGMIASMLDDDEDRKKYGDNPYLQLPEYERRQNACFYIGHGRFIKVPLAVEIRAAYGLGDIASGVVLGNKELLGDEDPVSQSVAQLAQLTPVDVFGGSKLWGSSVAGTFVPSILQPILATTISDASGYYRGWTGSRITNANDQWNADDPNWTKATDKTSPFAVEAAHSLNTGSYMVKRWVEKSLFGNNLPENPDAADGTGVEKGYINIDPGKMQYLFEQYGSGPLKDINEFSETLTNMVEAEEVDKGKIPILKAVYRDNVPTNVRNNDKARWYRYKDDAESLLHEATRYSKHGSTLYGRELLSSKEGTIAQRVKHWDKYITKRRKAMNKTSDPVVKEACQDQINEAIHSAMQEIDAIEKKK